MILHTNFLSRTRYSAGILLLLRGWLDIPPGNPSFHGDMNCRVGADIHPFAFRTHAHALSTVITGYKYTPASKKYEEIAKGNPQWPQAFYPIKKRVTVKKGEWLAARCTYNTTGMTKHTRIGATAGDEMCNLYLMYYVEKGRARSINCFDITDQGISDNMPKDSDKPLPPNPLLEEKAKHKVVIYSLSTISTYQKTLF